jgi:hypothetical protein
MMLIIVIGDSTSTSSTAVAAGAIIDNINTTNDNASRRRQTMADLGMSNSVQGRAAYWAGLPSGLGAGLQGSMRKNSAQYAR